MKIAIYSGEIPSTTFIENLITGLAHKHRILLFGVRNRKVTYDKGNIKMFLLYKSRILLLFFSFYWAVLNALRSYRDFSCLKSYINGKKATIAGKVRLWNKYGPIVFVHPDIFHLQWVKGAEEWLFLKELFNIHLVVSFRGAHMNYSQIADKKLDDLYDRILSLYDGYHAVSRDILNNALVYGIDDKKAKIIPPAVSDELLKITPEIKENGTPLKLLSVGRNHWIKGYDVAIDACAVLARNNIDFTYTIVGGLGAGEEFQFQIAQMGLKNNVSFIGTKSQNKIWNLYRESDLLILPSHAEGIPNVVLEAMACGLPVISTSCGGVSDVISNDQNGWLVPVRDPEALANQIIEFSRISIEKKEEIIETAFNTVKDRYVLSHQVEEMEALYNMVIS